MFKTFCKICVSKILTIITIITIIIIIIIIIIINEYSVKLDLGRETPEAATGSVL